MKTLKRLMAVSLAAVLAAACADTSLVSQMKVNGGAFETGLRDGYVKLADEEYDQIDWNSGDDYVERAKAAAMGKPTAPVETSNHKLVEPHKGQLVKARADLVAALKASATKKAPADAAKAQVMFDCWVEQAEENIQPPDIAACRKGFEDAMKKVNAAMGVKKPAKKKAARKPQTFKYVVYFDFNSSKLNKAGKAAVDFMNSEIKKGAKVSIESFTDRAGSVEYNYILATKRAKTVSAAIDASKVEGDIGVIVSGEERPAVATKDGAKQALNRRVEVSVTQ